MAGGAVLVAGVGHVVTGGLGGNAFAGTTEASGAVVAFEAEGENDGSIEEPGVGRAVGGVTTVAAIDAEGGVFEQKGAALVSMALDAGLFVGLGVLLHAGPLAHAPSGGRGAMGIVAVRALDGTFIDAMLEGHGELSFDVGMAAVAEVFLLMGEEVFGGSRFVDGVAVGADDFGLGVAAAANVGAGHILRMALQAVIKGLLGGEDGEGDDQVLLAARIHMGAPGAVAAFATAVGLGVGVAEKVLGLDKVAASAGLRADVGILRYLGGSLGP